MSSDLIFLRKLDTLILINVQLALSRRSLAVMENKMYKKAWCTCEDVVLLIYNPVYTRILYLCYPFTRDRTNSVTDYSTLCISKTCTVLRVPCKRKADPCKFLSVQKFKRGQKLLWLWRWDFGSEWCSPFVFGKDWSLPSIPSVIILPSDVVFIGDTGRNC